MVVIMQVLKDEVQENILKASQKLFILHGFEKTSIEKIAKEARISKSNLYNYFKSKDEIFNKLTDQAAYEFKKVIENFSSNQFAPKFCEPGFEDMMTIQLFNLISRNREGLILLVLCASGTKYENLKDELIRKIAEKFKNDYSTIFSVDDPIVTISTQNLFNGITNLTLYSFSDEALQINLHRFIHYHVNGFSALISD